ncbi:hypothetical protein pipiens_000494, partial [Culex pipiens pipiens]
RSTSYLAAQPDTGFLVTACTTCNLASIRFSKL